MRLMLCALAATAALAGCTSTGSGAPDLQTSLAASRGRMIAEQWCAGCHAIDAAAESTVRATPSFRQMRLRFNALNWDKALMEIADGRHAEMPPIMLNTREIDDLRAYIETLR